MSGGSSRNSEVLHTSFGYPAASVPSVACIQRCRPIRLGHEDMDERIPLKSARRSRRAGRWIEQSMQMDDEIPRLRLVDGELRLGLPRRRGRGVVRKNADDVQLARVLEPHVVEPLELAAEYQVQQLPRANLLRHVRSSAARSKIR